MEMMRRRIERTPKRDGGKRRGKETGRVRTRTTTRELTMMKNINDMSASTTTRRRTKR
jgi:hypothetical protein